MNFYLSSLDLRKGIIRSVIAVLLGIVFLIAPNLLPNTLVIILGATVLFVGIVSFLTIFTKDGGKPAGINYFNPDYMRHRADFLLDQCPEMGCQSQSFRIHHSRPADIGRRSGLLQSFRHKGCHFLDVQHRCHCLWDYQPD